MYIDLCCYTLNLVNEDQEVDVEYASAMARVRNYKEITKGTLHNLVFSIVKTSCKSFKTWKDGPNQLAKEVLPVVA